MAADLNAFPSVWRALLDADASTHLELAIAKAEGELAHAKHVLPPREKWFAALHHTAPEKVRVVIVGQDPYPTLGNAMGLAFSVPRGVAVPASLRNIYKGMTNDLDLEPALHGDLSTWAAQGVLLLNNVLTVEEGAPNSHAKFGWQQVTDRLITALGSASAAPKVFLLWGAFAQKKALMIDVAKHHVLTAPHPSPLSARRGFFDCKHFSKSNVFLSSRGLAEVDWRLPV